MSTLDFTKLEESLVKYQSDVEQRLKALERTRLQALAWALVIQLIIKNLSEEQKDTIAHDLATFDKSNYSGEDLKALQNVFESVQRLCGASSPPQ